MKTIRPTPVACMILLWVGTGLAADPNAGTPVAEARVAKIAEPNVVESITVAIMDFESQAPGNPNLGVQLGDVLTARLGIHDQFRLVERRKLQDAIGELQLNLSGLVEEGQATRVGKILGARILIFGRAFPVDQDLYIVAKVVGTETSRVKGIMAKGSLEGHVSDVMDELVAKLVAGLEDWAPQLLPENERLEPRVERLKQQIAGRDLPTVAVAVSEQHGARRTVDPAASTEIKRVLKEIGFNVIEADRATLERWTRNVNLAEAGVVISGEGVSEFGAQLGGLVSCVARLEIQAVWKDSGKVIAAERTTRRAVDLSETIAAKTALQAAGHELAIEVVAELAKGLKPPSVDKAQ